ncbi:hypothetical protein ACLK1T_02085 [Escherichia coli]
MHDYYARYLPQMALAVSVPSLIVVAIFPLTGLRRSFCWALHRYSVVYGAGWDGGCRC